MKRSPGIIAEQRVLAEALEARLVEESGTPDAPVVVRDPYGVAPLSALGPEPLEEDFDAAYLYASARGRKRPVKSHILDQGVVAGIGNIYADEILFRAGVRPKKSAARLTKAECAAIVRATKEILAEAICAGGSTIRDYVDSSMRAGSFQLAHQVYGRAGNPCYSCGSILKSVTDPP